MQLILVRHATALDIGEQGIETDFDRPLSEDGQQQARELAATLAAQGITLDAVVSSPLVRAVQTADPLLSLVAEPPAEAALCDYFSPEDYRAKKLTKFLLGQGGETIALVGHMPSIGAYAAWLIGAEKAAIPFEKAGAALISFDGVIEKGQGTLEWLIGPSWFKNGAQPSAPKRLKTAAH